MVDSVKSTIVMKDIKFCPRSSVERASTPEVEGRVFESHRGLQKMSYLKKELIFIKN